MYVVEKEDVLTAKSDIERIRRLSKVYRSRIDADYGFIARSDINS